MSWADVMRTNASGWTILVRLLVWSLDAVLSRHGAASYLRED